MTLRTNKIHTRSRKAVAAVLGFTLVAGMGAAFAAFLGRAEVRGSARAGAFAASWSTSTSPQLAAGSDQTTCPSVALSGTSSSTLSLNGASSAIFPGDACDYTAAVALTASRDGYISGLVGTIAGDGLRVSILPTQGTTTYGCGTTVPKGSTPNVAGSDVKVRLRVEVLDTATPGQSWTISDLAVGISPVPGTGAPAVPDSACVLTSGAPAV